jgi:hypothetical protein
MVTLAKKSKKNQDGKSRWSSPYDPRFSEELGNLDDYGKLK